MAILHRFYAFTLLYIDCRLFFQKSRFAFPEGEDKYGLDGIVVGIEDDVTRRSRKIDGLGQFLGNLLRLVGIAAADGFGNHHE